MLTSEGGSPAAPLVAAATDAAAHVPPLGTPRWPASALFRWEEQAGPHDAWDTFPFPPGGPGVLARLRAAAAASRLLRGRGDGFKLALSAELNAGGASRLLPLKDDEDVDKAAQLWRCCPGIPSVIDIVGRDSVGSATRGGGAAGSCEPPLPLPLRHGGGGSQPQRPAPAALGNALPVEMWAGVMKAVTSSRCVSITSSLALALPLPPLAPSGQFHAVWCCLTHDMCRGVALPPPS